MAACWAVLFSGGGLVAEEDSVVLFPALAEADAADDADDVDASLTVEQLMDSVVGVFPREPLDIRGTFLVRRRRGVVVGERAFAMTVNWGAEPSTAFYRVMDEGGRHPVEEMSLIRRRGRPTVWRYRTGTPLQEQPLPDLYGSIQGSDVSWMDLSLSFLWWPGGAFAGEDRVRGYACHIVEIPAPKGNAIEGRPSEEAYAKVRLWIEKKQRMLLQAEGYDAEGVLIRRLWVRSVRKIDERWMIKDMEVQRYPAAHRTKVTIQEVTESDPS